MATVTQQIRTLADLANRRVAVLGLARSGIAAARALSDAGARVTVYDRRTADELRAAVESLGGRPVRLALAAPPAEVVPLLAGADMVVTSPSVSPRFPTTDPWLREALVAAEAAGVEVVSEIELFLRLTRARVLGITGTKGKTTTTALVGAILERAGLPHAVGGNIGTPLLERLDELGPDRWAVLELSELQLPTISRGADLAVYTNIAADHLDRHGSVEAYRAVKARLAELTTPDGRIILNADDPGCVDLARHLDGAIHWYGMDAPELEASAPHAEVVLGGASLLSVAEVPLPGRHMLANVLAAALAAHLAGADRAAIAAAIRDFPGVPHRLETIRVAGGVRWVNDSQATIPLAALAALRAFDAPVVLVAGGQGKGLDTAELVNEIAARCRAAVLIGETAAELQRGIADRVPVVRAADIDEAVERAARLAQPGDVVLLSPAAASFDMFADYAARGDAFRAAVMRRPGDDVGGTEL